MDTFKNVIEVSQSSDIYCDGCQKSITGKIISALGKTWHPEHFVCTSCKKPITGDKFNQKDGQPYCEEDFSNLYLKKCAACNEPIKDRVIVALSKNWHQHHFKCSKCGVELAGNSFFEKDGNPFCKADYNELFAPRCAGCNGPITDTCIMALNQQWHQACFRCIKCGKPVVETTFEVVQDKPVCASCSV